MRGGDHPARAFGKGGGEEKAPCNSGEKKKHTRQIRHKAVPKGRALGYTRHHAPRGKRARWSSVGKRHLKQKKNNKKKGGGGCKKEEKETESAQRATLDRGKRDLGALNQEKTPWGGEKGGAVVRPSLDAESPLLLVGEGKKKPTKTLQRPAKMAQTQKGQGGVGFRERKGKKKRHFLKERERCYRGGGKKEAQLTSKRKGRGEVAFATKKKKRSTTRFKHGGGTR